MRLRAWQLTLLGLSTRRAFSGRSAAPRVAQQGSASSGAQDGPPQDGVDSVKALKLADKLLSQRQGSAPKSAVERLGRARAELESLARELRLTLAELASLDKAHASAQDQSQSALEKSEGDASTVELFRAHAHELEHVKLKSAQERLWRAAAHVIHPLSAALEHDPHIEHDEEEETVLLEIRAHAGGADSFDFAARLARMYDAYISASCGLWRTSELERDTVATGRALSRGDARGVRKLAITVTGPHVSVLALESGAHRVQLIAEKGSIQTSFVDVLVLPVSNREDDVVLDMKDVQVDVMRSQGAGGQHVNKTESAVRMVHTPTGTSVLVQTSRSQLSNRTTALSLLRAKLRAAALERSTQAQASARRGALAAGARVRTYEYHRDRVTDHRLAGPMRSFTGVEAFIEGAGDDDSALRTVHGLLARQEAELQLTEELDEMERDAA